MRTFIRASWLSLFAVSVLAAPASAQPAEPMGQISGVASAPGGGLLADATAQLRDLVTKEVIGTAKTNASGQFVFLVDRPGSFIVEILNAEGAVVGTTGPIVLSPGAMVVSGVAVSPTAGGAAGAAGGAAAGQGEQGQAPAPVAPAGTGTSSNLFMPTLPAVSSAVTGSGVAVGAVPSQVTASSSR